MLMMIIIIMIMLVIMLIIIIIIIIIFIRRVISHPFIPTPDPAFPSPKEALVKF